MTIQVTISSIVGTPPYNIYVCQVDGSNCFYIDRINSEQLPYIFDIPEPYNNSESYLIKAVDVAGSVSTGSTFLYATVTPTSTPTATPTPTITLTSTVTQTPTPTSTITPTSTSTPGSSPSSTPTLTPTLSPTTSETPTQTPTVTVTETPGASPSPTPSDTPTQTPTSTSPETPTPTISETPTQTPTPTLSSTPGETPTPTTTETPTQTPSSTPGETPTPTVTETPTQTPSPTITSTTAETPTPTITSTPTETPTPTVSQTQTTTPTLTPTMTPSPSFVPPNPALLLDFDASVATNFTPTASEGITAAQWDNLVVGGTPFTATTLNRPTWTVLPSYNNLGSLSFGANKSYRNFTSGLETITGFTIFYVFNTTNTSALQYIYLNRNNAGGSSNEIIGVFDGGGRLSLQYSNSGIRREYNWTTNVTLLTVIYDGSLTDTLRFRAKINGVDATPDFTFGNWPTSLPNTYGFILGSSGGETFGNLQGNIGAWKFYNTSLGNSEITTVENQLMTKFGI